MLSKNLLIYWGFFWVRSFIKQSKSRKSQTQVVKYKLSLIRH